MKAHPAAEMFPLIEGAEYAALVDSIRTSGLREAIWLTPDGLVLDGRNRLAACTEAGVEPEFRTYDGDDPWQFVYDLNYHRRHLTESQRGLAASRMANAKRGGQVAESANLPIHSALAPKPTITNADAAAKFNVSERTVRSGRKVLDQGVPELVAKVERDEVKVSAAAEIATLPPEQQREVIAADDHKAILEKAKEIKQQRSAEKRTAQRERTAALAAVEVPMPDRRYSVIYADPPWRYDFAETDNRAIENHYPTMTVEDIAAMEIPAADDAVLFMWATNPKLTEAFQVLEGWGFSYVTNMVWVKGYPTPEQFERQSPDRQGYSREAHLYRNGFSVAEIGEVMNRSGASVRVRLRKQGIDLDAHRESQHRAALTERQMEVLDGEMLGDGCIALGKRNINARLQWNLKSTDHVALIEDEFAEFDPERRSRPDRDGWSLWTAVNRDLTRQYERWYPGGVKSVPIDLELTPTTCFHWYIGDGHLRSGGGIDLYTNGFTQAENIRLAQLLATIGVKAKVRSKPSREDFYLGLDKPEAEKFIAYIGHCRVPDYAHKWGDPETVLLGGGGPGMGYYARSRHELLFIAKRGTPATPEPANRPDSVISAPRTRHSAKPVEAYELIERMYPGLPKLEMFCRSPREGWDAFGNEAA